MRRYRNKAVRLIAGMLSVMLLAPAYPAEMSQVNAAKKSVVVTDGGAVTWDFKDESAAIYEADDASGMKVDGSLSISGRFEWHDVTHGAVLSNGTTLSVKVPAGETTIRIGVCVHTNSALTVQLTDRNATAEEVSLPLQAEQEGEEQILRYRSTQDTVVDIQIRGTGSGYMHHLTAETATLQEVTTVSGNVLADNRVSVDGQKLLFEDEEENVTEVVIQNGRYRVSLPVGHRYKVAFKNADIYQMEEGSELDLTDAPADGTVTQDLTYRMLWDSAKVFRFSIGGTAYTITPGETPKEDFQAVADGGTGSTELATADTAVVWADLDGDGRGRLTEEMISDVTDNVTYTLSENTMTFTYTDAKIAPKKYTLQVKDNSASGIARANGEKESYLFGDGSIVSKLYTGKYTISGGEWELLTETKETSYRWTPDGAGTYEFRAGGRLGSEGEVTYCEKTAVIEDFLPPLAAVELTLSADADTIGARWTKTEEASGYQVYRYSADEGVELAKEVFRTDSADVTEWTDTNIEPEVPYYYYVIAFQYGSDETTVVNTSNSSRTVWAMASEGHTGDYLYEEEAAGLHITESPDGTVFDSQVSLGGSADRSGTAVVSVNGTEVARQELSNAGEEFLFDLELSQGRNEIELLFVDRNEAKTRRVYNVVWLTGYDMIVDASCKGRNETDESGRPIYGTVQEAVDAVPADNKERKVIYIRSGDYKERLTVSSPYISLVGENREHVRIHCYPAELYPADSGYEAGGDMTKRCATYITGTAVGFSAENITFANDYVYASQDGKTNKSADALRCDADGASFVNVKFRGVQDTLYMHAGNQYFYQCRIEGLIDFIYCGDEARVLFDDCDIVCIYEKSHTKGGYICAPRTAAGAPYGLVFQDCAILSENGCKENSCYLARPWRQEGSVIWINCYMGAVVKKETPYADMGDARHEDARFYEYGSYGPGYTVNAERRQLSLSQIEKLRDNFGWDPEALLTATGNSYRGNTEAVEPEVPETNLPQPGTGEQNPEQSGAGKPDTGKPDAGQSDAVQSGADRPERPQEEVVVTEQPAAAAGVQEARVTVEEEVIPLRKNREKIEFGDSIVEDPTRMVDDLAKERRAGVLPWILAVIILAAGAATGGVITIRKKRK